MSKTTILPDTLNILQDENQEKMYKWNLKDLNKEIDTIERMSVNEKSTASNIYKKKVSNQSTANISVAKSHATPKDCTEAMNRYLRLHSSSSNLNNHVKKLEKQMQNFQSCAELKTVIKELEYEISRNMTKKPKILIPHQFQDELKVELNHVKEITVPENRNKLSSTQVSKDKMDQWHPRILDASNRSWIRLNRVIEA